MVLTNSMMVKLGSPAPDFSLPGVDGATHSLGDFADARALLIVFTCNHCPYAQAVEDRLIAIGRDYKERGLAMAAINSNDASAYPGDSFERMKARAAEKQYPFPYLHDETQSVARACRAACTPDPFLYNAERILVYRGRIDDNWKEPEKAARRDLREAIEAVLESRPVGDEQLSAMGCNIKWKPGNEPK